MFAARRRERHARRVCSPDFVPRQAGPLSLLRNPLGSVSLTAYAAASLPGPVAGPALIADSILERNSSSFTGLTKKPSAPALIARERITGSSLAVRINTLV